MSETPTPERPNPLGSASLALGILSISLVFGIGLCALTGVAQQWIQLAGTPLFVCGGSSAFLGLLGAALGLAGLFGKGRTRSAAAVGLVLGLLGLCLFLVLLSRVGGG